MKILFYVAGMPFDGDTIKNGNSLGGSESAGYYIARETAALGHEVIVFSNIQPEQSKYYDGVCYMPIGNATKEAPLGESFTQYACTVPHDVLVIQRVPTGFLQRFKSKMNIWWTHDLALTRTRPQIQAQLVNIDKTLAVSNWHKEQVQEIYKIQDRVIDVLPNGVDHDHYNEPIDIKKKFESKTLIFSSRPERGLDALVKSGGIMEKLWVMDPEIKLFVTCYNHVSPDMKPYYEQLWQRCQMLPNVELMQFMSKQDLAVIESNVSLYVYPTNFEETSCITAMNSQVAGTPFVAGKFGALTETLSDGGVVWVASTENGEVSVNEFAHVIFNKLQNFDTYRKLSKTCTDNSKKYSWKNSAKKLESIINETFETKTENKKALINHFIENSDILILKEFYDEFPELESEVNKNFPQINGDYSGFYDEVASYNADEIKNNHQLGNDNFQLAIPRMQGVLQNLSAMPEGSLILDYGCCVGQHTVAWARRFPHLKFVGADISSQQVGIAKTYASENNIKNVEFCEIGELTDENKFDAVICCEVLEHVVDYVPFIQRLNSLAKTGGRVFISVPSGPWEKERWNTQTVREHVSHFEYQDICDIFGELDGFFVQYFPHNQELGTHFFGYTKTEKNNFGSIDIDRKLLVQSPIETVSTCIITRNECGSLERLLKSIRGISEQIVVGVDTETEIDVSLKTLLEKYECEFFPIESPLVQGFDEARNKTIAKASSDWILWIDADEIFQWPERLEFYLRKNNFDSYAIAQHHFSAEPAGKIKTDIPCRLFRNNEGIRFYGVVHEHPEQVLNNAIPHTSIIPENHVAICHNGYETEDIRRERFQRNFPLMERDREKYPSRDLGKFLWLRDLCHLNRFEYEQLRRRTPEMFERAKEGLNIWREFIKNRKARFCMDSLEYVSEFSTMLTHGNPIDFEISLGLNFSGIGDDMKSPKHKLRGLFETKQDITNFTELLVGEKMEYIPDRYV